MTKESSPKHKNLLPNEEGLAMVNLCYEQRTLLKTSRRTKCLIHLLHGTFYMKRGKGRCYKIICLYCLSVLFINEENIMLQIIVFRGCWCIFMLHAVRFPHTLQASCLSLHHFVLKRHGFSVISQWSKAPKCTGFVKER